MKNILIAVITILAFCSCQNKPCQQQLREVMIWHDGWTPVSLEHLEKDDLVFLPDSYPAVFRRRPEYRAAPLGGYCRKMTLHFTPTYASWLNQIEIWFGIFTRDVVKGGVWRSTEELIDQIMLYVRKYNEERARPFTWTYTGKKEK